MLCNNNSNQKASTLEFIRADDKTLNISLKNSDGTFINAVGWTIKFTVRDTLPSESISDDTDAVISKSVAGDATGIQSIELSSADLNIAAGAYYADFQVIDSGNKKISAKYFILKIISDVTRS